MFCSGCSLLPVRYCRYSLAAVGSVDRTAYNCGVVEPVEGLPSGRDIELL